MSTPQDPDRPAEQPAFPDAPPPESQGPGQTGQQGYPPPPQNQGYGQQPYPGGGGQQPYPGGGGQQPYPGGGDQQYPSGDQQQYPGREYAGGPAGSEYGNAPAYNPYGSPGFGTPAGRRPDVAPPKEVVWATYAMYAAIALSLIGLVVTLADSSGYKQAIRDADTNRTVDVDTVYTATVVLAVVVTLLISALYVFLAVNIRKGKNWARITAWVVVGLFTLFGLFGLGSNAPGIAHLLAILVLLANVATLVLLALRPSNQFFAAMRQPQF